MKNTEYKRTAPKRLYKRLYLKSLCSKIRTGRKSKLRFIKIYKQVLEALTYTAIMNDFQKFREANIQ